MAIKTDDKCVNNFRLGNFWKQATRRISKESEHYISLDALLG